MTTVTAKNLRDNLSEYLDRLQEGEEFAVIRRSQIIGTFRPAQDEAGGNGAIVAQMLDRNKARFASNKGLTKESVTTKELYRKALDKKYS